MTLVEVVVAAAISTGIIGGSIAVMRSTSDLARNASNEDSASYRVSLALGAVVEQIRQSSNGSILHLDGSLFQNGSSDTGFTSRRVLSYSGGQDLGPPVTIRFDVPAGKTSGELVSVSGPVVQVLVRGITDFRLTRASGTYTVSVSTMSGQHESLREADGQVNVRSRNP